MIHCRPLSDALSSRPIVGSATLTAVVSSSTMPEPSTVASTTQRPDGAPSLTRPMTGPVT